MEEHLCDLLLRRAGAVTVEGLQHAAQPCPPLAGQASVRWNGAAMQRRKEAMNRFEPVEAVEVERHDRRECRQIGPSA